MVGNSAVASALHSAPPGPRNRSRPTSVLILQLRASVLEPKVLFPRCCLWCFQKFLEFINRNTLIMVGVKGKGYCSSAARATALLFSNLLRVAVVNTVSGFLMWCAHLPTEGFGFLGAWALLHCRYLRPQSTLVALLV